MFLHGVGFDKFSIACEDTLISPQHWDDEPFEVIVSNPPYSIKWAGDENPLLINDPRFAPAGVLAPRGKADLAFIMHSLAWLKTNGTASIVCFPGIMYRGGAEQKIRKYLVDNNFVDCVIQLPENLFFGTTIATCIMVLKKNKTDTNVLFVDASSEFWIGDRDRGKNSAISALLEDNKQYGYLKGKWAIADNLYFGDSVDTSNYLTNMTVSASKFPHMAGTWYGDTLRFGSEYNNSYHTRIDQDQLTFYYGSTEVGDIECFMSYVDIQGTFKTNGSNWISTSDVKVKNSIEELDDKYSVLFNNLIPRTFKFNEGKSDRRFIYQCNHKFSKGKTKCTTPNLTEDDIKSAFIEVFNQLIVNKDEVVAIATETADEMFDTSVLEGKKKELTDELSDQKDLIDNLVKTQNIKPIEQETFLRKYNRYKEKFSEIKKEIEVIRKEIESRFGKRIIFKQKTEELQKADEIKQFNDIMFTVLVEKIVVNHDKTLKFVFSSGQKFIAKGK